MRLAEKLTFRTFVKGWDTLRNDGLRVFYKKMKARLRPEINYDKWLKENSPGKEEIKAQRNATWETMPLFSVVVPVYRTPEPFLRAMIESVINQTYGNWELLIGDGGYREDNGQAARIVAEYQKLCPAIRYKKIDKNLGIAENTNEAMEMAGGDYLVFMDHDDLITVDALYEAAKAIQETGADILYSDEDKIDMQGRKHFMPHFKPDFNMDLLRTVNYICHLLLVRKSLADELGGFRPRYNGAQDYDFILRCVERSHNIHHIPKILYHWRSHEHSTAENPESKLYAFEAGRRAIEAHYKRLGIPAAVEQGISHGIYRTAYLWNDEPFVSVLIPNKDHREDLKLCLDSLKRQDYRNLEIIIIENNSQDKSTFDFYKELEKEDNVRIVTYEGEFNYSKINNYGAGFARGGYLWLLNNDVELIGSRCLTELLGFAMRDDVGVTGARLYFGDGTIQHAGVVIGFGGIAGHTFVNQRREELGYFARAMCQQDYSAVTAACLLTRTDVFRQAGGMTEELSVAFNDIDYCLKVRRLGKLVVYNPYAEAYHYESKSRGAEDTKEKVLRFHKEILLFAEYWGDILKNGDPYYNPNLTLDRADFALKTRREMGRPWDYYLKLVRKEVEKETSR